MPPTVKANTQAKIITGRPVPMAKIIGRYFFDLSRDNEMPLWIIKRYEDVTKSTWEFEGSGIG